MNVLEMFLGTSGGLDAVINIAVYAVIVLLFIAGVIRCIAPIAHTRATIRRAIRNAKKRPCPLLVGHGRVDPEPTALAAGTAGPAGTIFQRKSWRIWRK